MKKTNSRSKITKMTIRIIAMVMFIMAFLFGIGFSASKFADNYTLGGDFKGQYSAIVEVKSLKDDPTATNQPNGSSVEGASILEERLNPMGILDVRIERVGKNYLKVTAPIDSYDNENQFKNEIQKSGGVIIMDKTFNDVQFSSHDDQKPVRTALSDYFKSAKADTIVNGASKQPALTFNLNGSNFTKMISDHKDTTKSRADQPDSMTMNMAINVDSFLDDVRSYYNTLPSDWDLTKKLNEYYSSVINPLRDLVKNPNSSNALKNGLNDLFYVKYKDDRGTVKYDTLMDSDTSTTNPVKDANALAKVFNTMEFVHSTSKYVYDPNAKGEDFVGDDARYGKSLKIATVGERTSPSYSKSLSLKDARIDNVFNALIPKITNLIDNPNVTPSKQFKNAAQKWVNDYFLIYKGKVSETANGSFGIVGDKFIVATQTISKAKSSAAIFNSSSKGVVFTVDNVSKIYGNISQVEIILAVTILLIIAVIMAAFIIFLYRIMGLFTIIVAVMVSILSLLSTTWFGLPIGPEIFASIAIIFAINIELSAIFFDQIKWNLFNKKRGLKTAFNIANKDTIGIVLDSMFILIVINMCLFWVGTSAIKIFATVTTIGAFMSVLLSFGAARIWYQLLVNTNILNSRNWLVALNTDFAAQSSGVLLSFKIKTLEDKIIKLTNKEKTDKVAICEEKLSKLKLKLEEKDKKIIAKTEKAEIKYNNKNQIKLDKLKAKLAKFDKEKQAKKYKKCDLKIDDIKYIMEGNGVVLNEQEGDTLANPITRSRHNYMQKTISSGSKILGVVLVALVVLSTVIGLIFGVNFGYSFGQSTNYIFWGDNVKNAISVFESNYGYLTDDTEEFNVSKAGSSMSEEYKEEVLKVLDAVKQAEEHKDDQNILSYEVETLSNYFSSVLSNKQFAEDLNNTFEGVNLEPENYTVIATSGLEYDVDGVAPEINNLWIQLNVNSVSKKDSRNIKSLIRAFTFGDETGAISVESGFISKKSHSVTSNKLLVQMLTAIAFILIALIVYILIRFKWTYYVAIALSVIIPAAISAAAIVLFRLPLEINVVVAFAALIALSIIMSFIAFGRMRTIIKLKNEKSLEKFFDKEIEASVLYREFSKEKRTEISLMKFEFRKYKKTTEDEKTVKQEKRKELKISILEIKKEMKMKKRESKLSVSKESRKNNYLKEVLVNVFSITYKRMLVATVIYFAIVLTLIITMPSLFSFGLTLLIGFTASAFVVLFIGLPLLILLEQIRIRQRLSSKRFINNISVTGEEQLIEGVNS